VPEGPPRQPVAVVLDFDGTIVRSMELHAEAYRRALEPYGAHPTVEEIFAREGARSETIVAEYLAKVGKDDKTLVKTVSDHKQRIYTSLGPPPLYPGAEDMVRRLRENVPKLGLVTGTRRENLERLVPWMVPLLDALLSQESYTQDKPNPEPYTKTADALHVPPSRCAALENAPRGVRSAVAAGYDFVVALPTTVTWTELTLAGAHYVANDHADATRALLEWVANLNALPTG